jgi:hypothetical protein
VKLKRLIWPYLYSIFFLPVFPFKKGLHFMYLVPPFECVLHLVKRLVFGAAGSLVDRALD